MGTLLQDLRFGLRMLARNPGFTAIAVLTLALGIGGTTAMFSVIYCGLLDPFPYADTHRLAVLVSHDTRQGDYVPWAWVSAAEFLDYREQNHVFDEVIGERGADGLLTGTDTPEFLNAMGVTDNFFRVLGVPPLIGRPLTPEDAKPGAPPVVVLSHKAWQRKFGGDPGIVGRVLVVNRKLITVVGVMPPRFSGAEMWVPATLTRGNAADQPWPYSLTGHLKPGVTIEQAKAEVSFLAKRFATLYPKDHPPEVTYSVLPLADAAVGDAFKHTLFILLGAVGFLLLIGCVNVANLLLARATGREREFAIRAALGASRGRLVRQLLIESLLLAFGGAVLGCLLAWDGLGALVAIIPSWYMPSEAVIRINGPVLLFTLGAALVSTLLFSLAPALLAVMKDLQAPLNASGRGSGESLHHRHRLRNLLVVGEVTLSLVLLTGAGLLIRGFFALRNIELGYNLENVLRADTWLPTDRYKTPEQRNQFYMETLRRVRSLLGADSAVLSWPTINWGGSMQIEIPGRPSAESRSAWLRFSSDGFFETLRVRLLQGRAISEEDFVHARKVAVVNRAFVTKYLGGDNPLGQQVKLMEFQLGDYKFQPTAFEIVGVAADTTHAEGTEPTVQPTLYIPYTVGGPPSIVMFVRTRSEPGGLVKAIRREVAAIDNELPVEVVPAKDDLGGWYMEPRFVLTMLVAFASLGLVLVSVGVYSVLSYAVSRRTQEIGIRMALGAQATDVRRMVLMSGLRWLAVGIGIGVPASMALAKVLQNRIWGIKSADALTLVAVSLVLTAVGLAACYIPARRATKVDPMVALRYE